MSKWDDTILSTLSSITRFENELPQLCGHKELSVVVPEDVDSRIVIEAYPIDEIHYDGCLRCLWLIGNMIYEGGINDEECLLPSIDFSIFENESIKEFIITVKYEGGANTYKFNGIIDFVERSSLKDKKEVYDITLEYGETLELNDLEEEAIVKDLHPALKLIFRGIHWQDIIEGGNWNDKIAIAKDILRYDIERLLTEHQILVDEEIGQKLIDAVANPETYALASDYKTIQLIYEDMAETSLSAELYLKKANSYKLKYIAELNNAWQRSNLDPFLTGKADVYRADLMGELER